MRRPFFTLDVFTRQRFAGNPLAVVLEADGLETELMQSVAREFNLSETVFVCRPQDARHRARLRIFTPKRELPFAGHPTVGTAVLLASRAGQNGADAQAFGLEEGVGIVPCIVTNEGPDLGYARFRLPRLPESVGEGRDPAQVAWALGLDPTEIGFERHRPSRHSAGVPLDLIPVASAEVLARVRPGSDTFDAVFGDGGHPAAYVYCRDPGERGQFWARMFAPGLGVPEDPATGSAAAAFAGALMQFEPLGEGEHAILIKQGYEMGRPSQIDLQLVIRDGTLASVEIGGAAIIVARGDIDL